MFVRLAFKIKNLFLQGLFTIFPITATIVVVHFGYRLIANWVAPVRKLVPTHLSHVPGVEFVLVVGFIFLVGAVLRIFILKSLISRIENLITRIPLIRPIYSSAKVLVDWMNEPNPTTAEKTVVLIEFPRKGCYNIAFLLQSARNNFETLLPESERQHDYSALHFFSILLN